MRTPTGLRELTDELPEFGRKVKPTPPVRAQQVVVAKPERGPMTKAAFVALFLFVFTMPLENAVVLPGIGTFARMVGLLAFACGLMALLEGGKLRAPSLGLLVMTAYVVWVSLTYFWSLSPDDTVTLILTYLQLLSLAWLIWQLAPTHERRLQLFNAYLIGSAVSALASLMDHGATAKAARDAAFNMNPNDVGLRMALCIPMSLYLSSRETRPWLAWLYRGMMLLATIALFRTASRGALVSFCISLLMIPLTFAKWNSKQKMAMVAALLIAPI